MKIVMLYCMPDTTSHVPLRGRPSRLSITDITDTVLYTIRATELYSSADTYLRSEQEGGSQSGVTVSSACRDSRVARRSR